MIAKSDLTGVVLAGGLARRMGGRDKGLSPLLGRPLAAYAAQALAGVCGTVLINANRSLQEYAALGHPVIRDLNAAFDGPLAGILAALRQARTPYLLTVPCDSPLVGAYGLTRLVAAVERPGVEIAVAHDGARLHPVFLCLHAGVADGLAAFLDTGERKIDRWLAGCRTEVVDCSDLPEMFRNVNTPEDLQALEQEMLERARAGAMHG